MWCADDRNYKGTTINGDCYEIQKMCVFAMKRATRGEKIYALFFPSLIVAVSLRSFCFSLSFHLSLFLVLSILSPLGIFPRARAEEEMRENIRGPVWYLTRGDMPWSKRVWDGCSYFIHKKKFRGKRIGK